MASIWLAPFIAWSLSVLFTPLLIRLLSAAQVLDVPNARSSHSRAVPRGGGVAVAIACVVAAGVTGAPSPMFVAGAVGLGMMGFIDDLGGVPAVLRLAVCFGLSFALIASLMDDPFSGIAQYAIFALGAFWCTAYVNAFNFMDGANGMSVAQTIAAGLSLAAMGHQVDEMEIELLGIVAVGAAAGFAPFNVPTARVFLGDSGSYFLGFWLAGTAALAHFEEVPLLLVVSPFMVYLGDTGWTLVCRLRARAPITTAHREHSYQKLIQLGWQHWHVAALSGLVSACCSAVGFLVSGRGVVPELLGLLVAVAFVAMYLKLPGVVESKANPG